MVARQRSWAVVTRKCYECGGAMDGKRSNYKYTECGLSSVNLVNITVFHCTNSKCGAVVPEIPAMADLHRKIAFSLITKETLLSGPEIRFLRKMAGLTGVELAQLLGSHKTNLSKWENGTRSITKKSDSALRLLCFTAILQQLVRNSDPLVPKVAEALRQLSELDFTAILQRVKEVVTGPKKVIIDPQQLAQFGTANTEEVTALVQ